MTNWMDLSTAYRAYRSAGDLWPNPGFSTNQPEYISTILALSELFDVFVLDGYGVLNQGNMAIPGMPEAIRQLQSRGKGVFLLTNAATNSADNYPAQYQALGYNLKRDVIVSARDALELWLINNDDGQLWGIGAPDYADLTNLGCNHILLGEDSYTFSTVNGFILLASGCWSATQQDNLIQALQTNPRPLLVANADVTAPVASNYTIEPGYFALEVAHSTGIRPLFLGKPFQAIFDLMNERITSSLGDISPDRIVMVGDTPFTDICGARLAGWQSALMADHGFMAGFPDQRQFFSDTQIYPDYVITAKV